jgi:hypothetical protein
MKSAWNYYLIAISQKKILNFRKTDFFTFFKKRSKHCFWSILTSDSERTSKIKCIGELSLTKTYFSKNVQKIKIVYFFRKKVLTQKNEFFVPLFILAHHTSHKT